MGKKIQNDHIDLLISYCHRRAVNLRNESRLLFVITLILLLVTVVLLVKDVGEIQNKYLSTTMENNTTFLRLEKERFEQKYGLKGTNWEKDVPKATLFMEHVHNAAQSFDEYLRPEKVTSVAFVVVMKISIALTFFFIIKILLGLYRYRFTHAEFFRSREAILKYYRGGKSIDIELLIKLLSTEQFDLGLPSTSPADTFAAGFQEALSKINKG